MRDSITNTLTVLRYISASMAIASGLVLSYKIGCDILFGVQPVNNEERLAYGWWVIVSAFVFAINTAISGAMNIWHEWKDC